MPALLDSVHGMARSANSHMARRALALLAFGLSATVDAATCASLACMEDLLAVTGDNSNSCSQYSTDEEACVKAYMTRVPGGVADGNYSPCEYSLVDSNTGESRYKPNDDPPYDTRCHSCLLYTSPSPRDA